MIEVPFRLLRSDDLPATNPHELAYRFGLQNTKGEIVPGYQESGGIVFDFVLHAKESKGGTGPVFTGEFASGPVQDRFVYLSWWAIERGHWINRVKARLGTVDWKLIQQAQATRQRISANMTGYSPHDGRKDVSWYLSAY